MQVQVHPKTTTTLYLSHGPPAAAESQQSLQPPQYAQQPPQPPPLMEPVRLIPNRRAPSPFRYSRNNETGAKARAPINVYRFNNPALQTSKLRPTFRTPTGGCFFFWFFFFWTNSADGSVGDRVARTTFAVIDRIHSSYQRETPATQS